MDFGRVYRVLMLYEHRLHPVQKYKGTWGSQEKYCLIIQQQNLLWR